MRSVFGIAKLQKLNASPMQSERCAAVGLKAANAAADENPTRQPTMAAPNSVLRIFVMTPVSFVFWQRSAPHIEIDVPVVLRERQMRCDRGHLSDDFEWIEHRMPQ
jgi:hypothetical protein